MEEVHVYPVFICDDEPRQITIIDQILGKAEDILADNNEIRFRTSFATNFEDAVKYFDQNKDEGGIYFLDIELGNDKNQNNGFDLAEIIKKFQIIADIALSFIKLTIDKIVSAACNIRY